MQCRRKAVGWCLIGKSIRRQRKRTRSGGPLLYTWQEESIAPACWRQGEDRHSSADIEVGLTVSFHIDSRHGSDSRTQE
jgi:hypothetical protein